MARRYDHSRHRDVMEHALDRFAKELRRKGWGAYPIPSGSPMSLFENLLAMVEKEPARRLVSGKHYLVVPRPSGGYRGAETLRLMVANLACGRRAAIWCGGEEIGFHSLSIERDKVVMHEFLSTLVERSGSAETGRYSLTMETHDIKMRDFLEGLSSLNHGLLNADTVVAELQHLSAKVMDCYGRDRLISAYKTFVEAFSTALAANIRSGARKYCGAEIGADIPLVPIVDQHGASADFMESDAHTKLLEHAAAAADWIHLANLPELGDQFSDNVRNVIDSLDRIISTHSEVVNRLRYSIGPSHHELTSAFEKEVDEAGKMVLEELASGLTATSVAKDMNLFEQISVILDLFKVANESMSKALPACRDALFETMINVAKSFMVGKDVECLEAAMDRDEENGNLILFKLLQKYEAAAKGDFGLAATLRDELESLHVHCTL